MFDNDEHGQGTFHYGGEFLVQALVGPARDLDCPSVCVCRADGSKFEGFMSKGKEEGVGKHTFGQNKDVVRARARWLP
jgi:hypothetical protein